MLGEIRNMLPLRVQVVLRRANGEQIADTGASLAMRISQSLALTRLARAGAVVLTIITSTFFLLCSFTFSYANLVCNVNVLWTWKLSQNYVWLYWMVFALNAVTLLPAFRHRRYRWWIEGLLIVLLTIGMMLTRVYHLMDLPLGSSNLAWSVVLALPLLCFGIHDLAVFGNASLWERQPPERILPIGFAFVCGALVGTWYFMIAWLRYQDQPVHRASVLAVLAITLSLHACAFAFAAALLGFVQNLMAKLCSRISSKFIASLMMIWLFASLMLRKLVTPALSFNSVWADIWALAYPICFVVMLAGWHVRRAAITGEAVAPDVEAVISGTFPQSRISTVIAGGLALSSVFAISYGFERVDWNFLFQRMCALAVWIALFTVTWRALARPAANKEAIWKSLACTVLMAACCLGLAQSNRIWHRAGFKSIAKSSTAYWGTDASFQVAQIVFRPIIRDDDATGLFAYLHRNAMIEDPVGPPKLALVESLSPTTEVKPNIYIIVVDCLRRDYLSAYNTGVPFTPRIGSFARESFVFQHAYTNYSGTALSEPAIWAGMMVLSKLYPEPFAPMNALEQLTIADGYHRLLLRDMILNALLQKLPADSLLSKVNPIGFDLRDELPEILRQTMPGKPLFVYAQPQNLHPITLHEIAESGERLDAEAYRGFNARYANELRKVDEAFGQFIDALKAKGQYDNSIIVLTADHGDWLGEYGRWGHGQSLLPVVMRVPLLIHLPSRLAARTYTDTNQTVFLTDIAPSLLYLLGHRDLRRGEFYGRPLFTQRPEEQAGYGQRYHLLMSSYFPVFGVLDQDNQTLYAADAMDQNQALYNLTDDPDGLDNIIDKHSQQTFEALTRAQIERLNALYGYSPSRH